MRLENLAECYTTRQPFRFDQEAPSSNHARPFGSIGLDYRVPNFLVHLEQGYGQLQRYRCALRNLQNQDHRHKKFALQKGRLQYREIHRSQG